MRKLSYILRHNPGMLPSGVDDIGGALVSDVLSVLNITKSQLKSAVDTDNKSRYELYTENGVERIRAVQGHSYPISTRAYTVINNDNDYIKYLGRVPLYHGTAQENFKVIKKDGFLRPMGRQGVHLHSSTAVATQVGHRHKGSLVLISYPFGTLPYPLYLARNGVVLAPNSIPLGRVVPQGQ